MLTLGNMIIIFVSLIVGSVLRARWRGQKIVVEGLIQASLLLGVIYTGRSILRGQQVLQWFDITPFQHELIAQLFDASISLFIIALLFLRYIGSSADQLIKKRYIPWDLFALDIAAWLGIFVFASYAITKFASESTMQKMINMLDKLRFPLLFVMIIVLVIVMYCFRKKMNKKSKGA